MFLINLIKTFFCLLTNRRKSSILDKEPKEAIFMNPTTEDIVTHIRAWSIDRASDKSIPSKDASSIIAEFYEWIEMDGDEIEIVSLETKTMD